VPAIVLDAPAGVEIVLWTDEGSRLAHPVRDADEVAVPDHFHLECAAALRRMELRGELTTTDAHTAFDQMLALRVRRVDTAPLLREAGTCGSMSRWPTRSTSSSSAASTSPSSPVMSA
jgi:predicted nucleic acid-binding protein